MQGGHPKPIHPFELPNTSEQLYGNVEAGSAAVNQAREASDLTVADVGRRVRVQGYTCGGTLRFVGLHIERGTLRYGVELDEPQGLNNGTVGVSKACV